LADQVARGLVDGRRALEQHWLADAKALQPAFDLAGSRVNS